MSTAAVLEPSVNRRDIPHTPISSNRPIGNFRVFPNWLEWEETGFASAADYGHEADVDFENRGSSKVDVRTVRETRSRRRLGLGWCIVLALISGAPLVGAISVSAARAAQTPKVVTVQQGQSIWSIVERIYPGRDPRPTVFQIVESRGSAIVHPGERLEIPPPN